MKCVGYNIVPSALLFCLLGLQQTCLGRITPFRPAGRRAILQQDRPLDIDALISEGGEAPNGTVVQSLEIGLVQQECIITFSSYFNPFSTRSYEIVAPQNNLQTRADACCASCHANDDCNAWQWCPEPDGCTTPSFPDSPGGQAFPFRGCQLMSIARFSPSSQNVSDIRVRRAGIPFVAGTPFGLDVPKIEGYELELGTDLNGRFNYNCSQSDFAGICMVLGNATAIADVCNADAQCDGFSYMPLGIPTLENYDQSPAGILKRRDEAPITSNYTELNPNSAVYIKYSSLAAPLVTKAKQAQNDQVQTTIVVAVVLATSGVVLTITLAVFYRRRYVRMSKAAPEQSPSPALSADQADRPSYDHTNGYIVSGGVSPLQIPGSGESGSTSETMTTTTLSGQPPGSNNSELVSPFMLLDPDSIAAMMAAAPHTVQLGVFSAPNSMSSKPPILVSAKSASISPGNSIQAQTSSAKDFLEAMSRLYVNRSSKDTDQLAAALEQVPERLEELDDRASDEDIPDIGEFSPSTRNRKAIDSAYSAASAGSIDIDDSSWNISLENLTLCKQANGTWWQLGNGAYGTVYRGLYKELPVAVKVLNRGDARYTEEFNKEIALLKSLRDKHVVKFLGACLDGRSAMLITELMELGDLWTALPLVGSSGDRIFSWNKRGHRVMLDVARGLEFLHAGRIVHRDLKSANILLNSRGVAKIADVGMARALNKSYLSMMSGNLGTFAWSAPEVLANKRCDEKVDIYSFGVVLWEVCTGQVPVRGDMRNLTAPLDCPPEVVKLYMACTQELPEKRPTAEEIVRILSGLLKKKKSVN